MEKRYEVNKRNVNIAFYINLNKAVQETARKDLQELVKMEINIKLI